jgi:hypothetical protein
MRFILAALGAAAFAFPAAAQTEVRSGQRVTLTFAGDKVDNGMATAEPATTAFEEAVLKHIEGPQYQSASGTNSMVIEANKTPEPDPIALEKVSFKLVAVAGGKRTLLVIRNGYGQALAYEAVMRVGNRSTKTGVCTVGPGRHGFEHWPHPIASITVTALRFEPSANAQPRCE